MGRIRGNCSLYIIFHHYFCFLQDVLKKHRDRKACTVKFCPYCERACRGLRALDRHENACEQGPAGEAKRRRNEEKQEENRRKSEAKKQTPKGKQEKKRPKEPGSGKVFNFFCLVLLNL